LTVYAFRARADPVSCRQRSWDSPFEAFPSRQVSARYRPDAPTCRFFRRSCRYRSTDPSRPTAAPGLRPSRESLAADRVFSTPDRRMLPWVSSLPGSSCQNLDPGFRPDSSLALCRPTHPRTSRPVPQSLNRFRLRFLRSHRRAAFTDETTLLGFLHRSVPDHSNTAPLGLWVHLMPRRALLSTADNL
jgi:hypothetical protein